MATLHRRQVAGFNIHYLYYPVDYFFDAQQRAGIQTLEFWGGAPHFWMDYMTYDNCQVIRKKARARGLDIAIFNPESCAYHYQVAAQEPDQRKKCIQYFKNGIQIAVELGARYLGINSGWGYWNESKESAWARSADTLSQLADEAQRAGITIAMESMRPEETKIVNNLKDAKRMFDEINSPALKILIDTCAMGVAGESLQDWFDVFGKDVGHTHFVDARPYGHLIWGDGCYPLEQFVQTLNDNGYEGYLGQEITDYRYFDDPAAADMRNMKNLSRFFSD